MLSAERSGLRAEVTVERGTFVLDVDISIASGSIAAVIGTNGAGKSTLIDAIAGLTRLQRGRVELDRRILCDVETGVDIPSGYRGIAIAFQDGLLFDGLSVVDNVSFGLRAKGMSRRDAHASVSELLERMQLEGRAHDQIQSLSGGLAARVSLARALAVQPTLLLLDEPFSSLDAIAAASYREWLSELLREMDTTTLLVTHDPRDVVSLADHVFILDSGRVLEESSATEISSMSSPFVQRFLGPNPTATPT